MNHYDDSPNADTYAELLAQRIAMRRYRNALMAHPDPRDPDYPGKEEEDDDQS